MSKQLGIAFKAGPSLVARQLDRLAEKYGVDAADVAARPYMLADLGLEPDDVDHDTIREAHGIHRDAMFAISDRYNTRISR